jgi:hypothetical protein
MITKSRYAISAMSLGVTLAFTVSPPVTALFQAAELRQASAVRFVDRGQPQLEVVADAVGRTPQNPTGTETRDPAGPTPLDPTGVTALTPAAPALAAPVGTRARGACRVARRRARREHADDAGTSDATSARPLSSDGTAPVVASTVTGWLPVPVRVLLEDWDPNGRQ